MHAAVSIRVLFMSIVRMVEHGYRRPGRSRSINRDIVGNASLADQKWAEGLSRTAATIAGAGGFREYTTRRTLSHNDPVRLVIKVM